MILAPWYRLFNVAGQKWMTDRSDDEMGIPASARGTVTVTGWLLALLALAGIAVALRAGLPRGPAFLWLVPVGLYLTMTPLTGAPRHRAVLDPFLILLAAPALVALWDAGRRVRRR